MIPLRLEIEGLYSYKEKQTIDFTQLTAAGLFGIFGAVGSGKSSILEAILLALYGSTERLSDRGEKNSMVNLQSDSLLIIFEFRAGKNNLNTYIARYSTKRNPKNFEDVKPAEHTFYLKTGNHLEPLIQRAEDIVGMKKEHFKQTVIIPQGKFREFIDLTPGPRAEMMKELFGLERFDLASKTGVLSKNTKEEKIRLETKLQALVDISEALLKEKETLLSETQTEVAHQKTALEKSESLFKQQEFLQGKHYEWKNLQAEWEVLEARRPDMESKKTIWRDFLKAKTYLRPVWDQLQSQQIDAEKNRISIINCRRFKDTYAKEIQEHEEELQELKEKADQKSAREAKIRDLQKVTEIKALEVDQVNLQQALDNLQPALNARKTTLLQISSEIQNLENSLENTGTTDSSLLAHWRTASKEWQQSAGNISKKQEEHVGLKKEIGSLEEKIKILLQSLPSEYKSFDEAIVSSRKCLQDLENEKDKLSEKAGLATHVHLLKDGKACPLCGSLSHPDPLESEKDNQSISQLQEQIQNLKERIDQLQTQSFKYKEYNIHLNNFLGQKEKYIQELEEFENKLQLLKQQLTLQGIPSQEDLVKRISETETAIQKKEENLGKLKLLRLEWEKEKGLLEEEENQVRVAENEVISIRSKILSKKEEIKDPEFCQSFYPKSKETIQQAIEKVEWDIKETAFKMEGKLKVIQETKNKQATNLANLENFGKNLDTNLEKIKELEVQFEDLKKEHGFLDQEELIKLFNHSIDADKVDQEIRKFEDRSLLVKNSLSKLESTEGLIAFSEDAFVECKTALGNQRAQFDQIQRQLTLIEQEIKTIRSQLKEKQDLLMHFGRVENRESNLKELERLFKGSGFVKYVSSIYLKELCNTANTRFMKLTKNSLSLEIDDNNTFWVIDYLNGGKKRLLKTLSGGQTFQASLCLALALAEKVKALNQADQSFFFLDEGFGALDKNALRVVFETLKSLRHENRIVGIISHVEELQQEIGVYAKIELDPERGSLVGYSF
jgi:exonuclease SbcC